MPAHAVDGTRASGAGGVEGQQRRVSVTAVRDRVVAAVHGGIDGDDVSAVGEVGASGDTQVPVVFGQDGQPAAFRGHVQPAASGVEGEYVRVVADLIGVDGVPVVEVDGEQRGVRVARNEGE